MTRQEWREGVWPAFADSDLEDAPDVFSAIDALNEYVEVGCIQHKTQYSGICPICLPMRRKAREGLAEIRRTLDLLANDTTAADLRQEIEHLKAEQA